LEEPNPRTGFWIPFMCETGTETKTPTLATASGGVLVWRVQPGYMVLISILLLKNPPIGYDLRQYQPLYIYQYPSDMGPAVI